MRNLFYNLSTPCIQFYISFDKGRLFLLLCFVFPLMFLKCIGLCLRHRILFCFTPHFGFFNRIELRLSQMPRPAAQIYLWKRGRSLWVWAASGSVFLITSSCGLKSAPVDSAFSLSWRQQWRGNSCSIRLSLITPRQVARAA
jgi:hypothetical protein